MEVLAAPADDERGSYGYMNGPGHAVVKACVGNRATCPEIKVDLKWGDGRRS